MRGIAEDHATTAATELRTGRALVTGCAGFIGSHLAERLVDDGWAVLGVDCFTRYYARDRKNENLERLRDDPAFALVERDLAEGGLEDLVEGVDVVFHLAGQPGVRGSFGEGFANYLRCNVLATQRLLEACEHRPLRAFVYASSSSVYGDAERYPTRESDPCHPVSPYGMTKLATEALADTYRRTCGIPTIGLRYFTAYGPRQRPDMAFMRFIEAALAGEPLTVYCDGGQIRDFTYVADVVDGTLAAARRGAPGRTYNLGGGCETRVADVVAMLRSLTGASLAVRHAPGGRGDARRTTADGTLARRELAFVPRFDLATGLSAQLGWALQRRRSPVAA
jgi:nucleoside-diphosphate-sugar epimerase